VPKSKEWVEIKPKFEGGSTNAFVKTTKREYHLDLSSNGDGQKWHTQVSWTYADSVLYDATVTDGQGSGPVALRPVSAETMPSTVSPQMPLVNPEQLSFAYSIDGDAPFRPVQVFDDSTHTFVRLPEKLQELPALFVVGEDTKDVQLVNYAVQPPYLVVPRTMKRFVLKLGRADVTVTKQGDRFSWFGGQ
jgi:type IV secretion system protein VirB9